MTIGDDINYDSECDSTFGRTNGATIAFLHFCILQSHLRRFASNVLLRITQQK